MTYERKVSFKCDGCHRVESGTGTDWQPLGWVGVVVVGPPLRDLTDSRRWHLCENCAAILAEVVAARKYFTVEELGR